MENLEDKKKVLRQNFLALRQQISGLERLLKDTAVENRIVDLECFAGAPGVVGYESDGYEVEIRRVMEKAVQTGKTVALPRYNRAKKCYEPVVVRNFDLDLIEARYGLLEPRPELPVATVDRQWLWLIPAVAFDESGTRLGRGGGFYDRMLSEYPGRRIGVFYQCQFCSEVLPQAEHDQKLELAVTEIKVYNFNLHSNC